MAETKQTKTTKKPAAKKSAPKKAPAKKPAAKSAPKKQVAKPVTKKPAAKKAPAKKTVAKPAAKKQEPKKAPVAVKKSQATSKSTTLKFNADALPKRLFGLKEVHTQAIFDTVLSDRASRRFSTHKVKNRGEVSGTGKKPWRQKGTGRARTGSLRTPIFVGGGRAFGPTTAKNYSLKVNKKVRALAIKSALSQLANAKQVFIHEFKMSKPSTATLANEIKGVNLDDAKVLLVTSDLNVFLSARNLEKVTTSKVTSISVESLLAADCMVISAEDLKTLESLVK